MARPPKPYEVLKTEGKSHRTKAELERRKQGEKALATGKAMQESRQVKNDPVAHKIFGRVRTLLGMIQHNDAIYEQAVNRYCLLTAESLRLAGERMELDDELEKMRAAYAADEMDAERYYDLYHRMIDKKLKIDQAMDKKRSMLLGIEKEMAMTVAAVLRTVPRKPDDGEEEEDPMLMLLKQRNGTGS